jgi:hypothetical protein
MDGDASCTSSCASVIVPTFESGAQLPDSEATDAEVLTESKFEEEHRNTGEEKRDEIRNEKRTCQTKNNK